MEPPLTPMSLSLCDCLSPLLALHSPSIYFTLFLGSILSPQDPSQIPVYKPVPLSWTCM